MSNTKPATVLIVPGLRDHVAEHWQTLLHAELEGSHAVEPLRENGLSCPARVEAIEQAIARIDGPVILVAHSAGCLMTVHWARTHRATAVERIRGALLVTPPDLCATWPDKYPSPQSLAGHGWSPMPRDPLPFPTLVAASSNDPLASLDAVRDMAAAWDARLVELGEVGHMNPASGFGPWPVAETLIDRLQLG
jgi:predicted alpha/beta hydrolase family esterase